MKTVMILVSALCSDETVKTAAKLVKTKNAGGPQKPPYL